MRPSVYGAPEGSPRLGVGLRLGQNIGGRHYTKARSRTAGELIDKAVYGPQT